VFFTREEDNGNSLDDLVDDKREKVGVPPRKTGIWSGGNVNFDLITKKDGKSILHDEDNGNSLDDLVDDKREKVGVPPRKTGIWSGSVQSLLLNRHSDFEAGMSILCLDPQILWSSKKSLVQSEHRNIIPQPYKTHVEKPSSFFAVVLKLGFPKPFTSDQSSPALVLDDSCFIDQDFSRVNWLIKRTLQVAPLLEHVSDVGLNEEETKESAKATSSNHNQPLSNDGVSLFGSNCSYKFKLELFPLSTKLLIISVYAPKELAEKREL
nr:hypothetical protein CTI12_AA528290 [Tanacetum cinerariifolium]